MSEGIQIQGELIAPGTSKTVSLAVGRLPSGSTISIRTFVSCSAVAGPTVLMIAGLHGDEINGIEILRRFTAVADRLLSGNVVVIPILNVYGFINFSRAVPDGKDVNRSFPGSTRGSLASRVAHMLTKKVLPLADYVVDFHTGSENRYNYPQLRINPRDPQTRLLAEAFGSPFILLNVPPNGSLRRVCRDVEKPVLVYEAGEALRFDDLAIEEGLRGLDRLLMSLGMVAQSKLGAPRQIAIGKSSWIRAPQAGIFHCLKKAGNYVHRDEPLGQVYDPYGGREHTLVTTARSGYLLSHNNTPVVYKGDALFHIGFEEHEA